MPLHPQVRQLRELAISENPPALNQLTVAQARAAESTAVRATRGQPEPVHSVINAVIAGTGDRWLPIRVYRPNGAATRPRPVLVYYYGGGWTLGNLDTGDAICRRLTNSADCVTVQVGYRLAPEDKFPAAVHDCATGLRWVAAYASGFGGDPDRLAVAGDSAGGNLAAAVCLLLREQGGPAIATQVLIYPNTHCGRRGGSMADYADPVFFNRSTVGWFWNNYLAHPADGSDPLASPLLAADHAGLPPALVLTAEYDPLRDEGEEYARVLAAAGVPVTARRYDGTMHGFFTAGADAGAARAAVAQVRGHLRDVLGTA
ncbi:alpha/beta hydrolase [Nocardia goodfellowii]|uniref:Acetyl esterase n=1 Tax=Nocardia goodfellowii TaxID=882446 RepID=A0ABS4Q9X4_9NOCA|nr:alpha/beta hydrolase [Nocardia goodfellowii]MBP2187899.1 acetyl esterase [Nocardia goodfellowii]